MQYFKCLIVKIVKIISAVSHLQKIILYHILNWVIENVLLDIGDKFNLSQQNVSNICLWKYHFFLIYLNKESYFKHIQYTLHNQLPIDIITLKFKHDVLYILLNIYEIFLLEQYTSVSNLFSIPTSISLIKFNP